MPIIHHSSFTIHHSPQGSISLIMLFVLAIGSLLGLFSAYMIQDMIASTRQLREFYQSYYIAKGGIELGILATNRYEYGFESSITDTDALVKDNLLHCKNCYFKVDIISRVGKDAPIVFGNTPEPITSPICNQWTANRITLSAGASYILPLFADDRRLIGGKPTIKNLLGSDYKMQIQSTDQQDYPIGIGIIIGKQHSQNSTPTQLLYITGTLSGSPFNIDELLHKSKELINPTNLSNPSIATQFGGGDFQHTSDYYNYLTITNIDISPSARDFSFCLQAIKKDGGYSTNTSVITSIGTYGRTSIGLQAIHTKPLLDYIINSNINL